MQFTPEHVHLMINHLPIVGFGGVIVLLAYSVIRNEPHTLGLGLGAAVVLAIATSLVMWTGEEAHERFMFESVSKFIDDTAPAWIEEHEERAEIAAVAAYATGGVALIGMIAAWFKVKWRRAIGSIVLVMTLATTGLMGYVADAGGKINHPEFRATPTTAPPADASDDDGHEHEHE